MNSPKTPRTSYLVAAMGPSRGALMQCYAHDAAEAERFVNAACLDWLGEDTECVCIDTGGAPGLFIKGDPAYIRRVITHRH